VPTRRFSQCERRGGRDTIRLTVECDLTWGHVFGVTDWELKTIHEIADQWRRWGDEITRRWIAAYPGSRPMAHYLLGLIPPCRWQHELPALRHPLRRIEGCSVEIADVGWHNSPRELDHLVELDVVDQAERRAAVERWQGRNPTGPSRYRPLAEDNTSAT
jgi:hypothetical protein